MPDAIAAQEAPEGAVPVDTDRLNLLFTIYNARLVKRFRARLGSNWHLADDLAQDTWVQVAKSLHGFRGTDDRAYSWLCVIAQRATAAHFRLARNHRETPTDFSGTAGAGLPVAPAAEDVAVERLTALRMAADPASPLGVAA